MNYRKKFKKHIKSKYVKSPHIIFSLLLIYNILFLFIFIQFLLIELQFMEDTLLCFSMNFGKQF